MDWKWLAGQRPQALCRGQFCGQRAWLAGAGAAGQRPSSRRRTLPNLVTSALNLGWLASKSRRPQRWQRTTAPRTTCQPLFLALVSKSMHTQSQSFPGCHASQKAGPGAGGSHQRAKRVNHKFFHCRVTWSLFDRLPRSIGRRVWPTRARRVKLGSDASVPHHQSCCPRESLLRPPPLLDISSHRLRHFSTLLAHPNSEFYACEVSSWSILSIRPVPCFWHPHCFMFHRVEGV